MVHSRPRPSASDIVRLACPGPELGRGWRREKAMDANQIPIRRGAWSVTDVTCLGCGCLCDDIAIEGVDQDIKVVRRACELGSEWFLQNRSHGPVATEKGTPVSLDHALERAAKLLKTATAPLVYGLSDLSCEAQRVAVALADRLGAIVDSTNSSLHGAAVLAMQRVGEVTCSLGEVRNRADVIVFWGTNPAVGQPRHFERYSIDATGQFVPGGRKDRTVLVVDQRFTETAARADVFYAIAPGRDFEALTTLRAILKGIAVDASISHSIGLSPTELTDLVGRLKRAKFGVIVFGKGLHAGPEGHRNVEALLMLTRELNAHTCFAAAPSRSAGNVVGAENVLAWQTGFAMSVDLSAGYPRYNPGEFTGAEVLARGEVDVALIAGDDAYRHLSPAALEGLARLPRVVIGPFADERDPRADVTIRTATLGVNEGGTVYRQDDVPLTLRPTLTSPFPSSGTVLAGIMSRLI